MAKPRIGVDIDEVLSASAESFVNFCNRRWGTNLTVEDYHEHWAEMWQVTQEEAVQRAKQIFDEHLYSTYHYYPKAKAVLSKLREEFDLVILTARPIVTQADTLEWVERHFAGTFSDVHFAGIWEQKADDRHLLSKAAMCREVGVDYLLDDQLKHCLGAAEIGIESVLFGNYPWNKMEELPDGVTRCVGWSEVGEYFAQIAVRA